MQQAEKLRLDKYLWSIRVFKTRSQASAACDAGKVKLNGASVKAARTVGIGDRYDIRSESRKWQIEVTGLLSNRVAYSEAIKYYIDHTPEEDKLAVQQATSSFYTGKRPSKIGRPTKKERRELDGFMEGGEEE
ncbi:RNA-binding S4 domain-containing protein [Chitinophaga pendula]|uniref:RNA-binding S4 domain-containing protein n=1 Tax=Chitinophaga TaxID=79328 RepID=UPI000BAF443B|nr:MULTISPECIES: RNA-binding S4 domain-containing protein [Chitinophaga]ASZ14858.1 RNA-binding protein [Chitinophaga sp. MD30]UCJ06051.1 RNA-binding S4 domain-containing protein [Chitinophaga pendula]